MSPLKDRSISAVSANPGGAEKTVGVGRESKAFRRGSPPCTASVDRAGSEDRELATAGNLSTHHMAEKKAQPLRVRFVRRVTQGGRKSAPPGVTGQGET